MERETERDRERQRQRDRERQRQRDRERQRQTDRQRKGDRERERKRVTEREREIDCRQSRFSICRKLRVRKEKKRKELGTEFTLLYCSFDVRLAVKSGLLSAVLIEKLEILPLLGAIQLPDDRVSFDQ